MSNINLESQLRDFQSQTYPTEEQTIVNNASILYKRKKYFLQDLRSSVKFLGFVLLGIVYLRDLSMLRFGIRAFAHYSLSNPFPTPSMNMTVSDESKKALSKFHFVMVLSVNSFCCLMHLVFGSYKTTLSPDGFLHGGMSIQFIGERLPYKNIELIVLDICIFFIQMVYHSLMCMTDDSEVLETKLPQINTESNIEQSEYEELQGDGYGGHVRLLTIDVLGNARKVLLYKGRLQMQPLILTQDTTTLEGQPPPIPGSFV